MARSDLPDPPIVIDLNTLADVFGEGSSNVLIDALERLLDRGDLHSTSTTRSRFRDEYNGLWERRDLDRIVIKTRSSEFKDLVTEARSECGLADGILLQRPISPKIDLIVLARMLGGTIITFDCSDLPISMKSLAAEFGVEVFDLNTIR